MPQHSPLPGETTLGIDIGGANLKYADTTGRTRCVEFPLWLRCEDLASQLAADIATFPNVRHVVATMTGELADCFLDRQIGVRHIIDALCRATRLSGYAAPEFYSVEGRFLSASSASEQVDQVAAANWHALANFVAQHLASHCQHGAILVDIGSTTSDLIPLRGAAVATQSRTDFDRLAEGSLVYVGGGRTPVCSLVDSLVWSGRTVPVMREVFATMDDVRVLLGAQAADASDCRSADGQPRDAFHAANRVARMIGLDHRSINVEDATELAAQIHAHARELVASSIERLKTRFDFAPDCPLIVSGHCGDLLSVDEANTVSLVQRFGDSVSRSAPAYALAQLFQPEPGMV